MLGYTSVSLPENTVCVATRPQLSLSTLLQVSRILFLFYQIRQGICVFLAVFVIQFVFEHDYLYVVGLGLIGWD